MDMLTFSKEREPDPVPGDLNQTVAEVVELAQARGAELNVAIDWQPCGDMPTLTFDPEGLHRAVLNIATNAIDACDAKADGKVTVSTSYHAEDQLARIVVEDNGAGIAPDDIDKVFAIFVSNKGGRGTGLGLPVSQKILREHGGDIRVSSTLGVGSTFTLELPANIPSSGIRETSAIQAQRS